MLASLDSCANMFNPFKSGNSETGIFANSEDPDEMPQNVAFHQGLHYLLRQIHSKEKFGNSE